MINRVTNGQMRENGWMNAETNGCMEWTSNV